ACLPRPASTGNIQRYLLAREVFSAPMSADTDTRPIGEGQMAEDYARFSRLLIDRPHPGVLRVVMNRPDKLNATDGGMHSDLTEIWRIIDADPSVSGSLWPGAGRAFSAAGPLDWRAKMLGVSDPGMRGWRKARDMVYTRTNCGTPVVAAINGGAGGAGRALPFLGDISIAAASARL